MAVLEAVDVCKSFGGLQAIDHVSFKLEEGKVWGFIGPNGAGKTTLYNLLTGFLRTDSGKFLYQSQEITNLPPHIILKKGIARSWQQVRLFDELTVLENIQVAIPNSAGDDPFEALFGWGRVRKQSKRDLEKAMSYLEFVGLKDVAKKDIGDLSYPEQKLVSMARLLATEAKVLLLDEPMSGLDVKTLEDTLLPLVNKLATEGGRTLCIIEHSVSVIKRLCNWVFFLNYGKLIAQGTCEELICNPELTRIYFGSGRFNIQRSG